MVALDRIWLKLLGRIRIYWTLHLRWSLWIGRICCLWSRRSRLLLLFLLSFVLVEAAESEDCHDCMVVLSCL
jgi:hypothetical protein